MVDEATPRYVGGSKLVVGPDAITWLLLALLEDLLDDVDVFR